MKLDGGVHLTYCSNIHPGETWGEVRANLGRHVVAVRDRLVPRGEIGHEFGVGLRLSARAAEELSAPAALAELREFLARERLYVFTINGFPYGSFHGTRVKEDVYLPDWRSAERLAYTNRLADLLATLLPEDDALEGSVSTVPGAFKPALGGAGDLAAIVEHLLQHVAHLVALHARTGRVVTLALEPEPHCFLETTAEAVAFFTQTLFAPAAVQRLAALTALAPPAAAQALQRHLGLCLDLCHAAVEYEDAAATFDALESAGIRVLKIQISAGLRLPTLGAAALAALARFDDAVYLHQVVQREAAGAGAPGTLTRFADLPAAFAAHKAAASDGRTAHTARTAREWRVHCHVPIFLDTLPPFASTQPFVREALALQRARPRSHHLEVETYTWDVLPAPYREGPVDAAVARELAWARAELAA